MPLANAFLSYCSVTKNVNKLTLLDQGSFLDNVHKPPKPLQSTPLGSMRAQVAVVKQGCLSAGASSSGQAGGQSNLPATVMLIFDSPVNAVAVGRKIRQLSSSLSGTPDMQAMALTESESSSGGSLDRLLSRQAPSPSCGLVQISASCEL